MSLPKTTIAKLIRESFTEGDPMSVPPTEKKALKQRITQDIGVLEGVKITSAEDKYYHRFIVHGSENEYDPFITFEIVPNTTDTDSTLTRPMSYIKHEFDVYLSKKNTLLARLNYTFVPIISLDELKEFVQACRNKLQQQAMRKIKTGRQRALKTQAILAQLKKIAKEEQFNFALETDTVKVKLYVEIAENDWVMMRIPFTRYQALLPKIQQALRAILEVSSLGIEFSTKTPPSYASDYYKFKDL